MAADKDVSETIDGGRTAWSEDRLFRLLVESVTDYALYMLSPDGVVSSWNHGAERIKGYDAAEIVGDHFSRFFTDEDRHAGLPAYALAQAVREGRFEAEGWRVRKDGSRFWAHVIIDTITDDAGTVVGFAKITRDITQQKEDADRFREAKQHLDLALSNISQGLCLFDANGGLLLANTRVAEMFGVAPDSIARGASFEDVIGAMVAGPNRRTDPPIQAEIELVLQRHRSLIRRGERRAVTEETRGFFIAIGHRILADGRWLTTFEDVTERYRAEARVSYLARHDALTGLPNRIFFGEHLKQELVRAARWRQQVAVIGLDLDRFKEINDLHGHAIGDHVLKLVATRIREMLRENEFAGRVGGDEFVCMIRYGRSDELQDFTARLEECILAPLMIDALKVSAGASFGVALFPDDGQTVEQLLKNADLAMYRAKESFGQTLCFYEEEMDEAVRARRAIAAELWQAIERHEFQLAYQPQKSVVTGLTFGCEALLRWEHPTRGLLLPATFIPIAEECGAILQIGEWVLRMACRDAANWPAECKVAVNVSPLQLRADLPGLVREILADSGLSPHRLELEITESTIIADKARALEVLLAIKALGVTVALDDFGTGYSSLDTLKSFPFDRIKLDRSFMQEVSESAQAKAVIRAILALGQSLSVPVLAEGVETEDQMALLRSEGCDEAQGYYLGLPLIGRTCG